MSEAIWVLIGIAGIAAILYTFIRIRVLRGVGRMFAISLLVLVTILLGNRLLSPDEFRMPSTLLPAIDSDASVAQTGWQGLPGILLDLLLNSGNFQSPTAPTTPVPVPSITPTPAPITPVPSITPTPAPVSPPVTPASPPVTPVSPSPAPVSPPATPVLPPPATPVPSFSPSQEPIPAWW